MLFCPGGQAEMVHAWRAFRPGDKRELVLHTRHRGFCRYDNVVMACGTWWWLPWLPTNTSAFSSLLQWVYRQALALSFTSQTECLADGWMFVRVVCLQDCD